MRTKKLLFLSTLLLFSTAGVLFYFTGIYLQEKCLVWTTLKSVQEHLEANLTSLGPSSSIQVLLVTTPRSGSSFLGSVLAQYPGTFYTFEPLYFLVTL